MSDSCAWPSLRTTRRNSSAETRAVRIGPRRSPWWYSRVGAALTSRWKRSLRVPPQAITYCMSSSTANAATPSANALAQPRRYASTAPNVLARITLVLREVAWRVGDTDDQQAVRDQLLRLRETVVQADLGTAETAELARLDALVERALAGRW